MANRKPLNILLDLGNERLEAKLLELERYDFSAITRSCIDRYEWTESRAKNAEYEAKRFFSLAFLDPGHYHIPEADVDEYWHRMILSTRWYMDFCDAIFGKYYHHTPEPSKEALNTENRQRSLEVVKHWFGYEWENLVTTCTQCKGPYEPESFRDLRPIQSSLYKVSNSGVHDE
jgi:hypothetical protein